MEEKKQGLDRREFLASVGFAATAVAGAALSTACNNGKVPKVGSFAGAINIAKGNDTDLYPEFSRGTYTLKDFSRLTKDSNLGLTPKNINNHLDLYANYVKKVNAAEASMRQNQITEASLKNLAFSLNGMFLHDIYFSNMNTENGSISKALETAISETFGSFNAYMRNLIEIARQKKGWSITAVNLLNGSIFNYGLDNHSANFPGFVMPILALDVYEHAYEIDFSKSQSGKETYLNLFPKIIDWDLVSRRYDHVGRTFA